jgi:glycosyltransferase involved in cell wall biosynthesis
MLEHVRVDLAHAHNIYGRLTTSVLDVLEEKGIPIVMTLHDLKLICPSYLMLNHGEVCERCKDNRFYNAILTKCHKNSYPASAVYAFETWLNHFLRKYEKVQYFIAPSQFLLNKHLEYGYCPGKFVYLPSFIDTSHIKPSFANGEYWLFFGRLSREKGVGTLLTAYAKLGFKLPLLVVGEGPERPQLEARGIPGVKFTGYLKGECLYDAISRARCIVTPSECYENSPLSVLEAMAYGKPVIGSRIGGIPELIEDGITGFIFEPGNAEDLEEKMESFLGKSKNTILDMGIAARKKVEQQFSAEAHYRQLMALYNKALSN